jgi:hypothetical protein
MDLPKHNGVEFVKRAIAAFVGVFAILVTAAPAAAQNQGQRGPLTVTVTCQWTPFWVFNGVDNLPRKAATPVALLGQRYDVIGGLRTTLGGYQYWETTVVVVEPGYGAFGYGSSGLGSGPGHYWISADCALPNRYVPR